MKKVLLVIGLILTVILGTSLFTACEKPDEILNIVNDYLAETSTANLIEQYITVKSGDIIVSSEEIVYNIQPDGVNGTKNVKTLNSDITSKQLYTEEENNFSFGKNEATKKLPVNFVVNKSQMKDESYIYEENALSFLAVASSVSEFFGITENETASVVSDIEAKIVVSNEKISSIEANYSTSSGHTVTVKNIYIYAKR